MKAQCRQTSTIKTVLFLPNSRWFGKRPWMQIPYTAAILTALLKDEFDFKLLDANAEDLSEEQCLTRLRDLAPDLFLASGLSLEYSQQYTLAFELAKKAHPSCLTVFGGVFPTLMPQESMLDANIDYAFLGHAEGRISTFLRAVASADLETLSASPGICFRNLSGATVVRPVESFISDMKEVVKPDYSLIDVHTYVNHKCQDILNNSAGGANATIVTSFGCPYDCTFCASRTVSGRKIAFRPCEDVLSDIEYFLHGFDTRNFTIIDENFLADRRRVESILGAIIDRKYNITWQMANVAVCQLDDDLLELMHRAGCTAIAPSIESGCPRVLEQLIGKPLAIHEKAPAMVRKCKELGINITAHFVVGMPGETWDEIRQTFRYAEELDVDLVTFHIATPYPKTKLYEIALRDKLLPEDFSFFSSDFYGTSRGFITTDQFTPFELMTLRSFEWDRINFSSAEKRRKIARMMNMTEEELDRHRRQTRLKCGVHY